MSYEYRIQFKVLDINSVANIFRKMPSIQEVPSMANKFNMGEFSDKPEATIVVESDGVYFCDHCGADGNRFLGVVVSSLVKKFGPVTIVEI